MSGFGGRPFWHGNNGYGHRFHGGFYHRFDCTNGIDRLLPYALGADGYGPYGYYGSPACYQTQTYRTAGGGWVTRPVYVCG